MDVRAFLTDQSPDVLARYTQSRAMFLLGVIPWCVLVAAAIQDAVAPAALTTQVLQLSQVVTFSAVIGLFEFATSLEVREAGLQIRNGLRVVQIPWGSVVSLVPDAKIGVQTRDGTVYKVWALQALGRDVGPSGNPPARKACLEIAEIRANMLRQGLPTNESWPEVRSRLTWPPVRWVGVVLVMLLVQVVGILRLHGVL